jgi:hypothetical protein
MVRAKTVDAYLDIQARALFARPRFVSWFLVPAALVILGSLVLFEHELFGSPRNSVKAGIGLVLAILGFAYFLYICFVKTKRDA